MIDGLLLIDKPKGWTSHDVVAKVRNVLRTEIRKQELKNSNQKQVTNFQSPVSKLKVGHTGTLDPLATGLMVLVVGSYCKRAQEFSKLDKTYEAVLKLGEISNTGDGEGEKTIVSSFKLAPQEIKAVLGQFTGEIKQIPPIHSAIKVDGKRAYKLARQGIVPSMEPRRVTIYSLSLDNYDYPLVKLTTNVSSGTYIRSLASDIGQKLEVGAYLADLRRIKIGDFKINEAIGIEQISAKHVTKITGAAN